MHYTKRQLGNDAEGLLESMARELERRAECKNCDSDDVSISGKGNIVRRYAEEIAQLVGRKLGLS
jgi:hypothetical protein